ncbi:MAG TPA: hypothetical protein VGQ04_13790 [Chitinophagaceae bacterium]|jgi:hypothetical protein|nr:hypothetical protein [Chitinophagaceae bacterium]
MAENILLVTATAAMLDLIPFLLLLKKIKPKVMMSTTIKMEKVTIIGR